MLVDAPDSYQDRDANNKMGSAKVVGQIEQTYIYQKDGSLVIS